MRGEPAEAEPGEFRPRDPDLTGGYYQPVRIDLAGGITSGAEREVSIEVVE